jgi:hypothetical protein
MTGKPGKAATSLSAATVGSTDACRSDGALGVCGSPFSAAGAAVRDALAAGRAAGCEQDRSPVTSRIFDPRRKPSIHRLSGGTAWAEGASLLTLCLDEAP